MDALRLSRIAATLSLIASPALAQTGSITGRVTDSASSAGIVGARVQAVNAQGGIAASTLTRDEGAFRLTNVAPATYTLQVTRIGFRPRTVAGVTVTSGGTATSDVVLTEVVTELNPVAVSASRREEKVLEAPASISVVDVREITERPSVTVTDHLKGIAGVDVAQGGVAQSNVVARGFNNAFSGSILTLQDYRFAGVPSLRVNVPLLFTGTNEDIERVEVLLGPASALYGPNSANGVLHVITKSPFTSQGTTLTLDGGERSLLRLSGRTAQLLGSRVGVKLSGDFFRANDFEYEDLGEPDVFPNAAPPGRRGQPNVRDFEIEKYSGEARLDFRASESAEFITTVGMAKINNALELTGANGTAQARNWTYMSVQQRARVGRWFGQVFANFSDAGNEDSLDLSGTFLLRSGQPIVDKSRVFAAQLQHSWDIGTKQSFVYGADYIMTNPRTGNTINGRNEEDDDVREIGGYVQSTTRLSPKFDFVGALRIDNNDQIDGNQISPRAALIFKPTPEHNFRATFNRAFSTPANFTYFLDLIQARNVGGTPFNVRALGNPPKVGWQFNRTCSGGLCMKSPFAGPTNPWLPAAALPTAYGGIVTAVGPTLRAGIQQELVNRGVPQAQAQALAGGIVQFLGTLQPGAADVGSRIAFLTDAPTTNIPQSEIVDIAPLDASYNKTYELGYKGILGDRFRLAVDAWYQQRGDVGNPAGLATPNVFYNPTALAGFLGPRLGQFLGTLPGLTPALIQQLVAGLTPAIAGGLSQVPQGIVQFNDERFASATDVHATYTSTTDQEFDVQGVDLALDYVLNPRWTLSGTYSWISDVIFEDITSSNGQALALNSPDHKASLTARYRSDGGGLGFEFRGRYTNAFPVNSGVYATDFTFDRPGVGEEYVYEPVKTVMWLDAGISYQLPWGARQALISINGTNILDNERRTFVGTPEIGRMIITRIQYTF
jgi:outer membrane receptor for ferrienterochelin and colicins